MSKVDSKLKSRGIEVSKSSPCVHCGKTNWCYVLSDGNMSVCKRNTPPAEGWYATTKADTEGTPLYATVASKEAYKAEKKKSNDKGQRLGKTTYRYTVVEPSETGHPSHLPKGRASISPKEVFVHRENYQHGKKIFQGSKTSHNAEAVWNVPSEWRPYILPYGMTDFYSAIEILQKLPSEALSQLTETIFIPEGEKCVDILREKGAKAICNYGGGGKGKWKESDAEYLLDLYRYHKGQEREGWQEILPVIVLMPDRDKPGLEHSVEIFKSLVAAGYPQDKIRWYFCYPEKGWDKIPLTKGLDIADMFDSNADLTVEEILENLQTTDTCPCLEHLFPGVENLPLPIIDDEDELAFCRFYVDEVTTDIDWLIQDILPSGYSVVLSGQSGSGKSVSAFDVAAAVAGGGTWMDKEARQGKVLILNNDQSEMVLKRMLKTRIGNEDILLDNIAVKHGFIADDEGLARLRKWMRKYDFRLVIMDSIRECICHPLGISQNDAESGYKLKQVAEVVTELGGCFVAIHHENKSKDSSGVEKASGSTSIISNVDAHWRITKGMNGNKLLMPKTRGYSPVEVSYNIDFTNGVCNATAPSEASMTNDSDTPTLKERVLSFVTDEASEDGATRKEIAEALGIKEGTIGKILQRLMNDSVIESVTVEGSKVKLYRLVEDDE